MPRALPRRAPHYTCRAWVPNGGAPNHLLEQFAREFMQLYPNAKLLVATKDDLARERRKQRAKAG